MSATIDGTQWIAGCVAPVQYTAGGLYMSGIDHPLDSGRAVVIALSISSPALPRQPLVAGTYPLGGPYSAYGGDPYALMDFFCTPGQTLSNASACSVWQVGPELGSGTITITDITSTAARGTFSMTMLPELNTANGPRTVTSGNFDVTF